MYIVIYKIRIILSTYLNGFDIISNVESLIKRIIYICYEKRYIRINTYNIVMRIKHFEIECFVGKGSFGNVYKGIDVRNNNTVAIKIDTSNLKVLIHEVSLLNYLYSEGVSVIPKIYWYGNVDNNLVLVMTYYKNSLQDYFHIKKIVNDRQMSSVMIKCLDILRQLFKSQIIHRDIKPQNFMIVDGDINIIDFGLSIVYTPVIDIEKPIITEIVGTPRFISYFVHLGEHPSPRDDLISLGYMYIYLSEGSLQWDEINREETTLSLCDLNHPDNIIRRDMKNPLSLLPTLSGPLQNYMHYCYSLNYNDTPDYTSLMRIFTN